jgi:hypothetical protein
MTKPANSIILRAQLILGIVGGCVCGFPASHAEGTQAVTNKTATTRVAAIDWTKDEPAIPQSEFVTPTSIKDGSDPFFPTVGERVSTAPADGKPPKNGIPVDSGLYLQGIAGQVDRRLCVINGRTLAVGEEDDIEISGRKLHVRCLEINETSVVIDLGGERRELHFKAVK